MLADYEVVLVSHNKLAAGILAALNMIAGDQADVKAYGLMPGNTPDEEARKISKQIDNSKKNLILADLYGGSMANAVIPLITKPNVKLITGLNLALALQAILEKPWTDKEIEQLISKARENIREVKINNTNQNDDEFF